MGDPVMTLKKHLVLATIAAALAASLTTVVYAGPIEDRQAAMKQNGKDMGELAKMMKGEAPYSVAAVKTHAESIAATLAKAKDMFPVGSEKGAKETWAKPDIWTENAKFQAGFPKSIDLAKAVAATKDEAAFKTAMGELGKNGCGSCHEPFRRPKE